MHQGQNDKSDPETLDHPTHSARDGQGVHRAEDHREEPNERHDNK